LIREYFPKRSSLDSISEREIYEVQEKLNNRPRKRLNWKTSVEVFFEKTGVDIYEGVAVNV